MSLFSLVSKYFHPRQGEIPQIAFGNRVEHLIDGQEYFGAIKREIKLLLSDPSLEEKYFYQAGWRTFHGFDFKLLGPNKSETLVDTLERMVKKDVAVRVFPWASPEIMTEEVRWFGNHFGLIANNLELAAKMRERGMANFVALDTLSHPLGSMHMKVVFCGGIRKQANGESEPYRVAFVSGLDIVPNRIDSSEHAVRWFRKNGKFTAYRWHDAGVRIEGPAAIDLHNYFSSLWDAQMKKNPVYFLLRNESTAGKSAEIFLSHNNDTLEISTLPHQEEYEPGTAAVQILRTLPKYGDIPLPPKLDDDWSAVAKKKALANMKSKRVPLAEIAPDGLFEYARMLEHVIEKATQYIYIEGSGASAFDALGWIQTRLNAVPNLRLIFLFGADPADGAAPLKSLVKGFNDLLLAGLARPEQIAFFRADFAVHSKIIIVDDEWATVGSHNFTRRSLYCDGEISTAVLGGDGDSFALSLRKRLWKEHFTAAEVEANSVDTALGAVFGADRPDTRPYIERMVVPFQFHHNAANLTVKLPSSVGEQGYDELIFKTPPGTNPSTFWPSMIYRYLDLEFDTSGGEYSGTHRCISVDLDTKTIGISPTLPGELTGASEGSLTRYSNPGRWFSEKPDFDPEAYFFANPDTRNAV